MGCPGTPAHVRDPLVEQDLAVARANLQLLSPTDPTYALISRLVGQLERTCDWRVDAHSGAWETGCGGVYREAVELAAKPMAACFCPFCGAAVRAIGLERVGQIERDRHIRPRR